MKEEFFRIPLVSLLGGLAIGVLDVFNRYFVVEPLLNVGTIPFSTGADMYSILGITRGDLLVLSQAAVGLVGYAAIVVCGLVFCRRLTFGDCFVSCSIMAAYRLVYWVAHRVAAGVLGGSSLWAGTQMVFGVLRTPLNMYSTAPLNLLLLAGVRIPTALWQILALALGMGLPYLFLLFARGKPGAGC